MAGESWALWVQVLCTWSVSIPRQLKMSGRNSVCGVPQKQLSFQAVTRGPCRAMVAMSLSPEHISDILCWKLHMEFQATQESRPHYFIELILFPPSMAAPWYAT